MKLLNIVCWTFEVWCDEGHKETESITTHRLIEQLRGLHHRIRNGSCPECGEPFLLWRVSLPGVDWGDAEELLLRETRRRQGTEEDDQADK